LEKILTRVHVHPFHEPLADGHKMVPAGARKRARARLGLAQCVERRENDLLTAVAALTTAGNNGALATAETGTVPTELCTAFSY
jgi:hypothetical protein